MRAQEFVAEKWSEKYKRSIDCSHPRGFSQRAHCQGRKKNEDFVDRSVAENRPMMPGPDNTVNAKKLWQYIKRWDEFLASEALNPPHSYVDNRLAGLFKTPDGQPIQVVFDAGHRVEYDNGHLYIPMGTIWKYPGMYQGAQFVKDVVNAISQQNAADEELNELTFKGSPCTKDCSGHRAGYEWSRRKGGRDAASWSPSFNNGAALFKNGF